MIDPQSESLVSITDVPALLPGRPSMVTVWRWRLRGVRGVKLEAIAIGGRVYTSREAIARFIAGSTAAHANQPAPIRTPAARERAIRRAEKELEKAGV